MSPTIFRERGFRAYFFAREESRPHVHMERAEGEAKFWLEPAVVLAYNYGLSPRDRGVARELIEEHRDEIRSRGKRGTSAEVTNVSREGVRIRVDGRSYVMEFEEFPWFRDATIAEITNVERPFPEHLRWPDLDVDLELDSIKHPERYPLFFHPIRPKRSRVAEGGAPRR